MSNEDAFVKAALNSWTSNLTTIDGFFDGLSDEALNGEIAPGKNRLIYLLGHFASVHDRMIALLGVGDRLHPELDMPFLTAKDREATLPAPAEIRKAYADINARLSDAMNALSPADWLAKHTAVSEEDFDREPHRNRYSVLLSRTNHIWYHYGQMLLTPKAT